MWLSQQTQAEVRLGSELRLSLPFYTYLPLLCLNISPQCVTFSPWPTACWLEFKHSEIRKRQPSRLQSWIQNCPLQMLYAQSLNIDSPSQSEKLIIPRGEEEAKLKWRGGKRGHSYQEIFQCIFSYSKQSQTVG